MITPKTIKFPYDKSAEQPGECLLSGQLPDFDESPGHVDLSSAWLRRRIMHVLKSDLPEEVVFPLFEAGSHVQALARDYVLTPEETVLLVLAFCAAFSPESLSALQRRLRSDEDTLAGGVLARGKTFVPTVRTALFLLAGKNMARRAHFGTAFHPKAMVFASGLVRTEPTHPSCGFMDYSITLSDQFWPAALKGLPPMLDAEAGFPVRKSKAAHRMDRLVITEKTRAELENLQRFARHMQRLWQMDTEGKIRTNFIGIFSGDPGTGKSFAAEAVGNEFDLPVYKVNFAQLVSKYIGETEKNLEKVFDRFDRQPCILFFDEAESIFSKRTEVTDANDQHANNLQSYLLQKVEEFRGIVILATNVQHLAQYFDKAFQRRIRQIVQFEFPDYPQRKQIWEQGLFGNYRFEDELAEKLARNYQLSGGSIYNVISDAVLVALDSNTELIGFDIIEPALRSEFKKTGRKYEVCTDEQVSVNPARRFGPGYEQRRNF